MVWIFLRGLTRETAHWGSFPDDFRRALPGSCVISLDLPGNGELHQMPSAPSIDAMVSYCRQELARRGENPPYFLLAMSLGAMVATQWSYETPSEIAGCVLINTSFQTFSPFYRRLRPRNYLALLRLTLFIKTASDAERAVLQLTSNAAAKRERVISSWVQARQQHPVGRANALRQLVAALRFRVRPVPPATTLLILCSEHDRLVHFQCSVAIALRWSCPLALHPWAGHDIALDDPGWVIEQVRRWLIDHS